MSQGTTTVKVFHVAAMAGKTSGSKSKNILSSLVELLPLFSEARIEFPIEEVEFETHHTRGPGTKFPCDPHM